MDLSLNGRIALVTGAARGIGAAIAARLLEAGCTVYVTDKDAEGARAHAAALGAGALALAMDVRERDQVRTACDRIGREQGGLDVLVNNAGVMTAGPFDATAESAFDELVAVNLTGVYNCVQAAAPLLREGGAMVNIASVSSEKGGGAVGNVWYGATKAAVVAITRGLARELGPRGIRVNAISPGLVVTDMTRQILTPEARERLLTRFPLGRLTETDDVARLAVFLASPASAFITGETVAVDGGFLRS